MPGVATIPSVAQYATVNDGHTLQRAVCGSCSGVDGNRHHRCHDSGSKTPEELARR
jgi:hypothetical protein